jgi:nucleoside-diphosphate kinase
MKMVQADINTAEKHYTESITEKYGEHVRKKLLNFITQSPVIAMVIEGRDAIKAVRKVIGSTFPGDADIGTIRGDFAHMGEENVKRHNKPDNLVHASANEEDAKSELALWFSIDEIHTYERADESHVL